MWISSQRYRSSNRSTERQNCLYGCTKNACLLSEFYRTYGLYWNCPTKTVMLQDHIKTCTFRRDHQCFPAVHLLPLTDWVSSKFSFLGTMPVTWKVLCRSSFKNVNVSKCNFGRHKKLCWVQLWQNLSSRCPYLSRWWKVEILPNLLDSLLPAGLRDEKTEKLHHPYFIDLRSWWCRANWSNFGTSLEHQVRKPVLLVLLVGEKILSKKAAYTNPLDIPATLWRKLLALLHSGLHSRRDLHQDTSQHGYLPWLLQARRGIFNP